MFRLTKRTVDAIKANGADTVYWDGKLTGFGLRVRKSGRKYYVVQTRVDGRLRWFTIGPHGPIAPDEARTKALEILADAKKGVDARASGTRHDNQWRVSDLCRRFLDEYVPNHCKPRTQAEYARLVTLFIAPTIGEMGISDVQRKDVAALHHDLRAHPFQANRTLSVLSKMFSLAEVWGWRPDGSNPCRHVSRYKERERFLSEEETARLGVVLREFEDDMPSAVAAFRLLLLTGCRMSEIRDLRWEHVKANCIELPDAKTGGRAVPLGPEARAVLDGIRREEGNPWVIAGRRRGTRLADLQRPWQRIRKRAGLDDVRIHDLRHTYASRALALGESLTMIGKLLGHTQVQTTARYAHLARDSIQSAASRITGSIGVDLLDDRHGGPGKGSDERRRAMAR
ncbi:MAG: site-specific integrase [Boseongicola sp. SB0662_bin_57]|nr:site-specific integrase [Boseongicola sp. SB0662_bin_57]